MNQALTAGVSLVTVAKAYRLRKAIFNTAVDDGLIRRNPCRVKGAGNMLAADAGANLRELMDRMGHSTARAAMVYIHGSNERQQAIADVLSRHAAEQLGRSTAKPSGTQRARRRRRAL